jgi:hypothetical protein
VKYCSLKQQQQLTQKKQCECQFPSSALRYPQQVYLECSQISPACPSDKSSIRRRLVWSIGGMTLGGKSRRILRKICPSATLSTTNLTWPDPASNTPSAITGQWHGHVMLEDDLNNICKFNFHLTENTLPTQLGTFLFVIGFRTSRARNTCVTTFCI